MILRDDQNEALLAVLTAWQDDIQRPAVVCPTGWGKTVLFAKLCSLLRRSGDRPLILVGRDELVLQSVQKIQAIDPALVVGVIQGKQNELRGDVTVASVQTLSRVSRLNGIDMNRFNRIICDEAHWAASDTWRRVLEYFGAFDKSSGCKAVGFTATMARTDKRGLGEIWDRVVFERETRWAIQQGFLVPVTAKTVVIPALEMNKIRTSHGDFSDGDLGRAMAQASAGPLVAQAYLDHCRDASGELRRGICFTPTVDLAQSFLRDFRAKGIPTELVIGSTPREERQAKYAATAANSNKVLMSVGVLVTGFDLPCVEICVMARPTKSATLYVQAVGRVLRNSPGKLDAMILDVVGASRLGLASIVDLRLDKLQDDEVIELDELDEDGLPMIVPKFSVDVPEEIEWQNVNPFDGTSFCGPPPKAVKPPKPRKNYGWDVTDSGVFFLPPTSTFEFYVFVWADTVDGMKTYTVGEKPTRGPGKAKKFGTFDTFEAAVREAEDSHPGPPSLLPGAASPAQLRILNNFRVDYDAYAPPSKAEASRIINRLFANRSL